MLISSIPSKAKSTSILISSMRMQDQISRWEVKLTSSEDSFMMLLVLILTTFFLQWSPDSTTLMKSIDVSIFMSYLVRLLSVSNWEMQTNCLLNSIVFKLKTKSLLLVEKRKKMTQGAFTLQIHLLLMSKPMRFTRELVWDTLDLVTN